MQLLLQRQHVSGKIKRAAYQHALRTYRKCRDGLQRTHHVFAIECLDTGPPRDFSKVFLTVGRLVRAGDRNGVDGPYQSAKRRQESERIFLVPSCRR